MCMVSIGTPANPRMVRRNRFPVLLTPHGRSVINLFRQSLDAEIGYAVNDRRPFGRL